MSIVTPGYTVNTLNSMATQLPPKAPIESPSPAVPASDNAQSFSYPLDADQLARCRDMAVAHVVVMLLSEPSDKILPILDRWAPLIRGTA